MDTCDSNGWIHMTNFNSVLLCEVLPLIGLVTGDHELVGSRKPLFGQWGMSTSDHSWWRHQMETFSALLAICAGNSPVTGEFLAQRPVTRSFGVFFDLRLNEGLSKQSWGWWFETPSLPLWRQSNDTTCLLAHSRGELFMYGLQKYFLSRPSNCDPDIGTLINVYLLHSITVTRPPRFGTGTLPYCSRVESNNSFSID